MRIWHESLIPHLCQKHLCAMWREGLGCYAIVTSDKKGYRNHPATQEFIDAPYALWKILRQVRQEMLSRGYHPKELPALPDNMFSTVKKPWQSLEEQISVLKAKGCSCHV